MKSPKFSYKRIHFNDTEVLEPTNADEIQTIICKLDPNKAPRIDNITNKLIKIIFLYDKDYLVRLFNLVLFKVKIPKQWKIGQMIFSVKVTRQIQSKCLIDDKLFGSKIGYPHVDAHLACKVDQPPSKLAHRH